MHSCIYEGRVIHRRCTPIEHKFRYRLSMLYLDLAELPQLVRRGGLISQRRLACASMLREDHLKHMSGSLDGGTRDLVESRTGVRPRGPIRLLTQLRYFGYYLSPLNLYFCFDADGREVEAVVAEVNNTPWGEQHCYVLWEGNRASVDAGLRFVHEKAFHVSPFMDMDSHYNWKLSEPGEQLDVGITTTRDGEPFFAAQLGLHRRPLTRWQLTRSMIRYPVMTARIAAAIYYQALRLWIKKCPFYTHPKKREASSTMTV